jgi:Mrp family chromosome partitioning ATPase
MASAGLRVLLVDADLRRPKIHEIFGLKNDIGLTTLLSANPLDNVTAGQVGDLAANLPGTARHPPAPA